MRTMIHKKADVKKFLNEHSAEEVLTAVVGWLKWEDSTRWDSSKYTYEELIEIYLFVCVYMDYEFVESLEDELYYEPENEREEKIQTKLKTDIIRFEKSLGKKLF